MARGFNGITGAKRLSRNTAVVNAFPFTMACWCYPTSDANHSPLSIMDTADGRNYHCLFVLNSASSRVCRMQSDDTAGGSAIAVTTAGLTLNAWHHVCGTVTSATSRAIYLNGGNKGTNATNANPNAALDETCVGGVSTGVATFARGSYFDGDIAEAAFWNVALTDAEVASLYNSGIGLSAKLVRPDALVAYWPLLEDDGDRDWWGNNLLTAVNSPSYRQHLPMIYPSGLITAVMPPAAVRTAQAALAAGGVLLSGSATYSPGVDTASAALVTGKATLSGAATSIKSPLKTGLIALWPLNETSGNATDVHGGLVLAEDGGSLAAGTGIQAGCRDWESSSPVILSIADNASISTGNIDASWAFWCKLESKAGAGLSNTILAKWTSVGNQREYAFQYLNASDRFVLTISSDGTSAGSATVTADDLGSPQTGVWYFVVGRHDAANNTLSISVDAGTPDSISHTTGIFDSTSSLRVGGLTGAGSNPFDGLIDEIAFWKRVVTTGEERWLYNAGVGRTYSEYAAFNVEITSPAGVRCYQRDGSNEHDITVSGVYTGTPTAIEYTFDGSGWATLDASLSDGTFSGTVTLTDGQSVLVVRFANETSITDSTDTLTVGDVFLIAGQSNAEGRASNAQSHSGSFSLASFREDDAWRLGDDPTDTGSATGSIWPLLSTHIEADQGVPVILITTAAGGTGLVDPEDWKKGGSGSGRYENMLAQVTASGVNSVKAVLFYEGETDVQSDTVEEDFYLALKEFSDDVAADVPGAPPVCAFQIGYSDAAGPVDGIRRAIARNWDDGLNVFGGPAFYDKSSSVHPASDALIQSHADRFWAALQEKFYGGAAGTGRGPRLVSAELTTSRAAIVVEFDRTLKTGLTFNTGAWTVVDSTGEVAISSVSYIVPVDSVLIALSTNALGPTTLSLGQGASAAGSVVPLGPDLTLPGGAGTANLPAETFVDEPVGAASFTATGSFVVGEATLSAAGEFDVPVHTGTAALVTGKATLSAAVEFDAPVFTGTAALVVGEAVSSAAAEFDAPVYTGVGALVVGEALLSASAEFDVPTYAGTAMVVVGATALTAAVEFDAPVYASTGVLVVGGVLLAAVGEFVAPVYAGTASLAAGEATLSGIAGFGVAVYLGEATLAIGRATLAGSVGFDAPVYTGQSTLAIGRATLAAVVEFDAPVYTGQSTLVVGAVTSSGFVEFDAPVYIGAGAFAVGGALLIGAASFAVPVCDAEAALAVGDATLSGAAAFSVPVYSGSSASISPKATISGLAEFDAPVFTGTSFLAVAPTIFNGSASHSAAGAATATLTTGATRFSGSATFSFVTVIATRGCVTVSDVSRYEITILEAERYAAAVEDAVRYVAAVDAAERYDAVVADASRYDLDLQNESC